ncbi:MAG: hypothetical protein GTO40_21495, partial [Deltaproteobacteria bacterium]|nr:hypothetical protein [Deltaproteobacteria bacterium]
GQDTLNAGTDFTTGSKESTEQKEGSFFSSQDWAETTSESPTAKKDEPLSATEFFAQSEQSPPQEQDPLAGSQDTVAESQESIYNPAENTVTPAEESAPSATEDADPFDFEREASHLGEETPLTGVETKKADEQISTKPKVREYKGKTFGVKKKIPSSDSEADSAPQTYVERRKPPIAAQESHAGGPVSIIPYISLFGILLLTFSLLTLIYQAQPAKVEAYLKSIPWFGSILFKNSHLRQGVVLESLNSGFRKIYGGRQVFVITGKILNRNQVSVRDVRLEGLIHTGAGKELGRQTISVGNPISSKIISDMTVREIAILQRLKPQKRFEIAPDGSAAFTIVFLRPSKDIKSFSCRVLTTKGTV